jgi:glucosamine-6-phosphate deaminase
MNIQIFESSQELGKAAGAKASALIKEAIKENGAANIILATGMSQFDVLNYLIVQKDIDWSRIVMFHLDEYIDLSVTHPASFRKYLQERFISKVPQLKAVYLIDGENDPQEECKKLNEVIKQYAIDVALVGIGENGHLAFNDPPADFDIEDPYIIVNLDEACRQQQLGEGWFKSLDEVPKQAISMSIKQIVKSKHILCSVPDSRKAMAVKNTLEKEVGNLYPASILQTHTSCYCYLDLASAALLTNKAVAENI